MAVIGLQDFAGMIPMRDVSLLPENAASYCRNAFLYSGSIQGFRESNSVHTVQNAGISSVYRIPRTFDPIPDFENSLWLEFYDPFISVVRAPVIEDRFRRHYFFPSDKAAPNIGPYYNTYERLDAGREPFKLGIPTPQKAPIVVCDASTTTTKEVRSYVYTWVSQFGEEGPPSPPTTVSGTVDGTWRIVVYAPTDGEQARRALEKVNIYRTVTAADGTASFYLCQTDFVDVVSFTDNFQNADITGKDVLPSTTWTPPPDDLQGVVPMANGILAGWSNRREVWFCEPYRPHAWPVEYVVVVDSPIVALAAIGTSLVILTETTPWIATGVNPSAITLGQIKSREPCISRGGVAPAGEGVYYPSPNGLILVNTGGTTNITQQLIDKEQWNQMGIGTFAASKYAEAYLAFSKGSVLHDNGLIIDHQVQNALFSWLSAGQKIINVYCDEFSGSTFLLTETDVIEWNPSQVQQRLSYVWRSREWRFPAASPLVGGVVYFDVPSDLTIPTPTKETRNASQNQDLNPSSQYLLLKVYADKRLVYVREIQQSGELILLPSGFKATYWQFEFEGQVKVREAKFATSVKELIQA